jgi:hypothetical protein
VILLPWAGAIPVMGMGVNLSGSLRRCHHAAGLWLLGAACFAGQALAAESEGSSNMIPVDKSVPWQVAMSWMAIVVLVSLAGEPLFEFAGSWQPTLSKAYCDPDAWERSVLGPHAGLDELGPDRPGDHPPVEQ